jgi:hypothetical protein
MNKVNLLEQISNCEFAENKDYSIAKSKVMQMIQESKQESKQDYDIVMIEHNWGDYSIAKGIFDDSDSAIFYLKKFALRGHRGILGATEFVKNYELKNLFELVTDLTNPIEVANSVVYILGLEIIHSLNFE